MDELFRGYVITKNKKSIEKFKNIDKLKSYNEVCNLPEFAGLLAEGVVLIDIDDKKQSDILLQLVDDLQLRCRVYETTRGKHFLFKTNEVTSCRTHCKLAIGLSADIKLGSRNSIEILKFNGKKRDIVYEKYEDENYQSLPVYLMPVKSKVDFINMSEGDGRNQELFNYILTLQSSGFSVDEVKETIKLLNKYVLLEPLQDSELETILRDEAFLKQTFFKNGTFQHEDFANFLIKQYHIKRIDGSIMMYKDGAFVPINVHLGHEANKYIKNLTDTRYREVIKFLDRQFDESVSPADPKYISFKNGILNIETCEMIDHDAEIITINQINYNYNQNAYNEILDKTLDKLSCNDSEIRSLLEEVAGYCFFRRSELRKCFILIGDKANGKSTYLYLIKKMLGDKNCCALDLSEIGNRFSSSSMVGKLANIGDDIGDEFIVNTSIFKKVVSGDEIRAERKGENEFFFHPYCKLLFSANSIPRIKDKSGAVQDRLVIIPFDATFNKSDPDFDPYIKDKLVTEESIEYFIKLAVEGLKRVLLNHSFTSCERVKEELSKYEESNNPVLQFIRESEESELTIVNIPSTDVYMNYNAFCTINKYTAVSKIEFSKQICRLMNLKTVTKKINGKTYRVFVNKD